MGLYTPFLVKVHRYCIRAGSRRKSAEVGLATLQSPRPSLRRFLDPRRSLALIVKIFLYIFPGSYDEVSWLMRRVSGAFGACHSPSHIAPAVLLVISRGEANEWLYPSADQSWITIPVSCCGNADSNGM